MIGSRSLSRSGKRGRNFRYTPTSSLTVAWEVTTVLLVVAQGEDTPHAVDGISVQVLERSTPVVVRVRCGDVSLGDGRELSKTGGPRVPLNHHSPVHKTPRREETEGLTVLDGQ